MKRTFPKAVSRILQKKLYTELQTAGRFLRESAMMCVHTDFDSAFGKAVVSTNSKGCISKISVDSEDYEMVLSDVKDANG